MSRTIKVKCTNINDCGHLNVFQEDELVSEIPLIDKNGNRLPPPPAEVDDNTFIQCEKCGYPINCAHADISD